MDMSRIQRALGVIEGVCVGMADKPAEIIECALAEIDEEIATPVCGLVRNDSECRKDESEIFSGMPEVTAKLVAIEREDYLSASQMDELVERLFRHYEDYEPYRCKNLNVICSDCKKAAEVIIRLRLLIEDLEYAACAERP